MKRQKVKKRPRTRLSDLPEHIAHHILEFLPTMEATKTSSLSTTWRSIWRSYPTHDFDEASFTHLGDSCRSEFLRSITAVARRNGHTPTVQNLRVSTVRPNDGEVTELINELIGFGLSQSKLLKLDIAIESSYWLELATHYPTVYSIPVAVFSSAKWLTSLTLQACSFYAWLDFSLPSLAKISLKYSFIDPLTLQSLISGCPLLEDLNIEYCFDVNTIRVFNHNLKRLAILRHNDLSLLEIDAPSLTSFEYKGSLSVYHNSAFELVDQCTEILEFKSPNGSEGFRSLKTASLSNVKMKESVSDAMVSFFSNVETACIRYCSFGRVSFKSNHRLTDLNFQTTEFESLDLEPRNIKTLEIANYTLFAVPIFKDILSKEYRYLRSLSLHGNIEFPNESLDNRFVGPFLEALVVRACLGLNDIKLSSASLKELVVDSCVDLNEVSITTPNLVRFKYVGYMIKLSTVIVPNQVEVDLNLMGRTKDELKDDVYAHNLWYFFKNFEFLKVLTVQSDNCETLTLPKRLRFWPPFRFLEDYKVTTILWSANYLLYLKNVLETAFCFGTVTVNTWTSNIILKFAAPSSMSTLMKQENLFRKHNCVSDHLKEVTIEKFQCSDNEMEVVAWLLRTAANLNSMNVIFKKHSPEFVTDKATCSIITMPKANPRLEFNFAVAS